MTDHTADKLGGTGASDSRLVGCKNFVRHNPLSDRFESQDFDHVEFWCGDAQSTAGRFAACLGFSPLALSDVTIGNMKYTSYVLKSHHAVFVFTAPFQSNAAPSKLTPVYTYPNLQSEDMQAFLTRHGMGVRAICIRVKSAQAAHDACVENGAQSSHAPLVVEDAFGKAVWSEIVYYDDVRIRFIERDEYKGVFLPGYAAWPATKLPTGYSFGIQRVDHCVSNVPNLSIVFDYISKATGWHEFGEFIASDVGTVESGLNSIILANNAQTVLLPINEPTTGTKRKSQIQNFIDHHKGPGIQHIALSTPDIFATIEKMQSLPPLCGLEFMPAPPDSYYAEHVPEKMKGMVTPEVIAKCKELGILIDRDEEGGLLQIFTKPVCDRPSLFFEIIQRLGCEMPDGRQKPACGGFGKGNFGALFKAIEDWEKMIEGQQKQ